MRIRGRPVLSLALLFLLLARAPREAHAHAMPYSYLDLRFQSGALEGKLTAHVVDLSTVIGLAEPEELLDRGFLASRADTLEALLGSCFLVIADGDTLRPGWTGWEIDPARGAVSFLWRTPIKAPGGTRGSSPRAVASGAPSTLKVSTHFFPYDPQHETYLNVYEGGVLRHQDLIDASHTEAIFLASRPVEKMRVFRTFLAAGIHHIFIGPDHILFIVGLLLLGGGIGRLLKIVTAFTVAHSITLALATFRILNPPSTFIEPAIALSIVCVGVENLLASRRHRDLRPWLAFGFGFLHGFGFASVLRDFGLPTGATGWALFSFNLGVEVGQSSIVLLVAPLLALTRERDGLLARRILAYGSIAVVLAGTFWFIQRVFFRT